MEGPYPASQAAGSCYALAMDQPVAARGTPLIEDPELALRICERLTAELLDSYVQNHGVSRAEARRAIRAAGQVGRTPSGVMLGRRR